MGKGWWQWWVSLCTFCCVSGEGFPLPHAWQSCPPASSVRIQHQQELKSTDALTRQQKLYLNARGHALLQWPITELFLQRSLLTWLALRLLSKSGWCNPIAVYEQLWVAWLGLAGVCVTVPLPCVLSPSPGDSWALAGAYLGAEGSGTVCPDEPDRYKRQEWVGNLHLVRCCSFRDRVKWNLYRVSGNECPKEETKCNKWHCSSHSFFFR